MSMEIESLKHILEAILLAAGRPLTLDQMLAMFADQETPERSELRAAIGALQTEYEGRGITLMEVAGGYRIQIRETMQPWVARLWEEKPARYSRALLETLSLIAYRQPITRGEIEEVRGVSVSTTIVRTLLEREWVHVVGYREVPGRPAMYGTTRRFLEYFSLKNLNELPSLAELRDLSDIGRELELDLSGIPEAEMVSANDDVEGGDAGTDEECLDEVAPVSELPNEENAATLH